MTHYFLIVSSYICISTHTLTWSVTAKVGNHLACYRISTHTLTWSVTFPPIGNISTLAFQLTRSRGAWHADETKFQEIVNFNSHAHVERDGSGAKEHTLFEKFQLTRSRGAWPKKRCLNSAVFQFQLTRSRGAWHLRVANNCKSLNFNSHAHVERDMFFTNYICLY